MKHADNARARQPSRPEHSEAYWRTLKYVILGLAGLTVLAIAVAVFVIVRSII